MDKKKNAHLSGLALSVLQSVSASPWALLSRALSSPSLSPHALASSSHFPAGPWKVFWLHVSYYRKIFERERVKHFTKTNQMSLFWLETRLSWSLLNWLKIHSFCLHVCKEESLPSSGEALEVTSLYQQLLFGNNFTLTFKWNVCTYLCILKSIDYFLIF